MKPKNLYILLYYHNLILKWTHHRSRFHRGSKYSFVIGGSIDNGCLPNLLTSSLSFFCPFLFSSLNYLLSLNEWNQTNFYILLQTFQIMQISKRLCSGLESVVKKSCHQWCSLQSKEKSALEKQHMVDLRCQGIPQKVLEFSYLLDMWISKLCRKFRFHDGLTNKQNETANLVLGKEWYNSLVLEHRKTF